MIENFSLNNIDFQLNITVLGSFERLEKIGCMIYKIWVWAINYFEYTIN